MEPLIGIIIALLVAGFVFWALKQVIGLIPMDPFFAQIINVLLLIVVVAIVLFYVIIPILHLLVGSLHSVHF